MKIENLQSLLLKLREKFVLRAVTLELTNHCNLNCQHCLRIKDNAFIPFEKVVEIVDDAYDLGTFEFTVTGGEPTLHPYFWDVLDYLTKKEMKITLFTNATWFDEDFVSRLRNYNITNIHISYYSLKKEVFEEIVMVKDVFEKYMRNLRFFEKYKLPVKLKTLIMTFNYTEIAELEKYADELGFDWSYNYLVFPRNDFSKDVLKFRVSDAILAELKNKGYIGHFDPNRKSSSFYICNMGRTLIDIAADGMVYPCIAFRRPVGNIFKERLRKIWTEAPFLITLRNLRPERFECFYCPHNAYCNRCPGLAFAEHGDFFKKPKESCRITNAFL